MVMAALVLATGGKRETKSGRGNDEMANHDEPPRARATRGALHRTRGENGTPAFDSTSRMRTAYLT